MAAFEVTTEDTVALIAKAFLDKGTRMGHEMTASESRNVP
jgi:hypothetical protein